jgi:Flp pilus assembly protein TadD
MRRSDAPKLRVRLAWRSSFAALVCLAAACAGSGGPKVGKLELQEDGGFTITERTRIPSGARSDFEKAVGLVEQGDLAGGIALLEQAAEKAPDATLVHIDLGIAYRLDEQHELAVKSLERAVELNPRHPMALNELGIAYRKVGRFDDARASYQKALAVVPGFHFARRNLAILCDVYLGDLECALEHYERYAEMMPDDEQVPIWIADLRRRTGR